MTKTKVKNMLKQHRLWLETDGSQGKRANFNSANLAGAKLSYQDLYNADLTGANLTGAYLDGADLTGADLTGADLTGAYLQGTKLTGAYGLPNVSSILSGNLYKLNVLTYGFMYMTSDSFGKDNFVQNSIGFFVQDNPKENSFDILVGDRVFRGIPEWVKYSGLSALPEYLYE
jgi:hypothetical protein